MSSTRILESNRQFISMMKRITRDRLGVDQVDRRGFAVCWADNLFPFWNCLFFNEEISDDSLLSIRLGEAARYMRGKNQFGIAYLCLDHLTRSVRDRMPALAADAGLEVAFVAEGMAGPVPTHAMSMKTMRFETVRDNSGLQTFADLNSIANGFPIESGRAGILKSQFWIREATTCIGYFDNQPVCASAVTLNEGLLYVSLVATLPSMTRRGFASSVVTHCLSLAGSATGSKEAFLHASQDGRPVYERLGFEPTSRFVALRLHAE